ncbi:MAG: leucine-rich repeat protein [Muribaculaceae bacterium]|nr:leucine-rich repeat protein [Muribaculaceae bacterium]
MDDLAFRESSPKFWEVSMKYIVFFSLLWISLSAFSVKVNGEYVRYELDTETKTATAIGLAPYCEKLLYLDFEDVIYYQNERYYVTSIGSGAFSNLGEKVMIQEGAEIGLPEHLLEIGDNAFSGCKEFTGCSKGNWGYNDLPDSIKKIGKAAFKNCSGLDGHISLPESVESIGDYAFYGCSGLYGDLSLPNSLESIGDYAFYGCSGFGSGYGNGYDDSGVLTIGNSVKTIGNYAFAECNGFRSSLIFPESVKSIGNYAFFRCRNFSDLSLLQTEGSIGYGSFAGTNFDYIYCNSCSPLETNDSFYTYYPYYKTVLYVPEGAEERYESDVEGWGNFKNIVPVKKVSNIILDKDDISIPVEEVAHIEAMATPEDAFYKRLVWTSSDDLVASVYGDGREVKVHSFRLGRATITVTCGDVSTSCKVTVVPKLDKYEMKMNVGQSNKLTANVWPYESITWTSDNEEVATVSEDGTVTAISFGVANITATCEDVSATCKVTVTTIVANRIVLSASKIDLITGESDKLTATVYPDDALDKSITWTSDNEEVAIISKDGTVTALSVGVANITATCGDVSATCKVTVTPIVATSIALSTTKMELVTGETGILTATVYPEDAIDKSITWYSNYPDIATISDDGIVMAISVGDAYITASCGDVWATCNVSVKPITASNVVLNMNELNLLIGESDKLIANVYPENAVDTRITWTSDNEDVAAVSSDGIVTAISDGLANVTAICGDVSACCTVNVLSTDLIIEGQIKYAGNPVTKVATVMGPRDDFEKIKDLIIPGTVKFEATYYTVEKIARKAFYSNRNLRGGLTLPNALKEVGDSAFCECIEIEGFLTIPPSVTSIGDDAFSGCKGFTGSLIIPASVTRMGEYAFGGCDGFTGSLTIPSSITSIEEGNFSCCSGFTGSLTIPNSVTSIGERAFWNCKGFTGSLVIPNSVTEIGNYAFSDCSGFTSSLTIPNSVTNIGYDAFSCCSGLTEVIISSSVKSIDHYAFSSCTSLKSVYYSAKEPISASGGVFWSNNDQIYEHATLYVPEEAIEKCRQIDPWRNFRNIQAYDFATGIVEIEDDINSDEPYEVYNLNGMKISSSMENLTPGLYIVTQGAVVKKINVK